MTALAFKTPPNGDDKIEPSEFQPHLHSVRSMFTIRRSITGAALLAAVALSAGAQSSNPLAARSSFSISAIQTRPQGALGRNIDFGYGANAAYELRIDKSGFLSLRADFGVVAYGNESKRTALSETVGDRIQVSVRTTNYLMPVSVGPQLMWPTGAIRPYVNAGVGGQAFITESDVEGTADHAPFASTTNQSDITSLWTVGGGVYVPVVAGKTNVQLDIGLQYLNGGKARYLAPGSIVDLPGGHVAISPMESATHLVVLRLGARIGL